MEKAKLMQKEIEDKRKLPSELKQEIYINIFYNILIAIIIVIYLCTINILFYKLSSVDFEQKMKIFALGIILVTVATFEVAYRKDSNKICIIGIELFICSVVSLYIPYIYLHSNKSLKVITMILPGILALYYLIKGLLIYKTRKIHYQSNLSDVKEILKDTEKKGYLDEESKKTYRENKKIEEKIKVELLEEQKIRKKQKQEAKNKKVGNNKNKKNKKK